jgi:hypothetical protein
VTIEFRLDHEGIGKLLRSNEMLDLINGVATKVAANARRRAEPDATVTMRPHITDRRRAAVIVSGSARARAHVIGAARDAGLEVTEYPA